MTKYVYVLRNKSDNNYQREFDGKGNESFLCFDNYKNAMARANEWEETFGDELIVEPICTNLNYVLYDKDTGRTLIMNMLQILEEINRDASDDWEDFNQTDYMSGLKDFTELELRSVYLVADNGLSYNE